MINMKQIRPYTVIRTISTDIHLMHFALNEKLYRFKKILITHNVIGYFDEFE